MILPHLKKSTFVSVLFLLLIGSAWVQESTSVDLGFDRQAPANEARMAITLSVPKGVEVSSATSEMSYPDNLLTYQDVKKGLSAQAVDAEVTATNSKNPQDASRSVVKIVVKSAKPIPSGMIADVVFMLSKDAPIGQVIKLTNKPSALSPDGKPIEPLSGKDGEITVTERMPALGCFFYMH